MYSNLVHLEFLRLMKSRYFKAAISIVAFFELFFFMFFHYAASNNFLNEARKLNINMNVSYQVAMANTSTNSCWIVALVAIFFVTCDYYKYRLYVNFQSQLKNKIRHCSSEFVGFFLFAAVLAIFPVIVTLAVSVLDKESLFTSGSRLLLIYITTVLVIFINGCPAFFFAKLLKKVWPSVICYILYILSTYFVLGFITGALSVGEANENLNVELIQGNTAYSFAVSVVTPENALHQWALGAIENLKIDFGRVIFNYVAICLFWLCACSLVTKRRGDK